MLSHYLFSIGGLGHLLLDISLKVLEVRMMKCNLHGESSAVYCDDHNAIWSHKW